MEIGLLIDLFRLMAANTGKVAVGIPTLITERQRTIRKQTTLSVRNITQIKFFLKRIKDEIHISFFRFLIYTETTSDTNLVSVEKVYHIIQ